MEIYDLVLHDIRTTLQEQRVSKLSKEHVDFLTSQSTLMKWSGKTLNERCIYFHRQFPNIKISYKSLALLYKKHHIKKKRINICKVMPISKSKNQYEEKMSFLKSKILEVEKDNYQIIYLDEIMFTYETLYYRDYSNKNTNIEINQNLLQGKTRAVIVCVSSIKGLEYYDIFDKSVNIEKFSNFLDNLKITLQKRKFAIFLDNMRVHHGKIIKKKCEDLDIPLIFNLPYSPQYNPIEQVFSIAKNKYKRMKLEQIAINGKYNTDILIRKSFENISQEIIKKICCSGYQRIFDFKN